MLLVIKLTRFLNVSTDFVVNLRIIWVREDVNLVDTCRERFVEIKNCSCALQRVRAVCPIGGFDRYASYDVSTFINYAISLCIKISFGKNHLNICQNGATTGVDNFRDKLIAIFFLIKRILNRCSVRLIRADCDVRTLRHPDDFAIRL